MRNGKITLTFNLYIQLCFEIDDKKIYSEIFWREKSLYKKINILLKIHEFDIQEIKSYTIQAGLNEFQTVREEVYSLKDIIGQPKEKLESANIKKENQYLTILSMDQHNNKYKITKQTDDYNKINKVDFDNDNDNFNHTHQVRDVNTKTKTVKNSNLLAKTIFSKSKWKNYSELNNEALNPLINNKNSK